jgi:hypothetical protein
MKELIIPPAVFESDDSVEFIRLWIADGREHVSLNIGAMGDEEVEQWGMMLADLSIHIIRGLIQDGAAENEATLRANIERAYLGRLKRGNGNHTGSLLGTRQ